MRLRLKGILQDVDFRSTELSIYEGFRRSRSFPGDPKAGEAYLFVSRAGNQLLWILHYEPEIIVIKTKRRRIESMKFRVSGGYWNPLMLANYAADIGIELEGIKRFEDAYAQSQERKRGKQ